MKSPAIQLLKVGSLLPWLAVLGIWLRSHYTLDEWSWADRTGRVRAVVSYQGAVHVIRSSKPMAAPRRLMWDTQRIRPGAALVNLYPNANTQWRALGTTMIHGSGLNPSARAINLPPAPMTFVPWLTNLPFDALWIPYWYAVVPLILQTTVFWILPARKRRRLRMKNCCENCGYDLRASVERCPECGTAIARAH